MPVTAYNQKLRSESYRHYQSVFWKKVSENRAGRYAVGEVAETEKNDESASKGIYPVRYLKFFGEYCKTNTTKVLSTAFVTGVNGTLIMLPFIFGNVLVCAPSVFSGLIFNGYIAKLWGLGYLDSGNYDNKIELREKYNLKMPWYLRGLE